MNNEIFSERPLSDVCISFALAYSEDQLSKAFSRIVKRIKERHNEPKSPPTRISHGPFETEYLPTSIEDGLWHFFANTPSQIGGNKPTCCEAYREMKEHMTKCFVPFRCFTDQDWEDAMRLIVIQNAMNIIVKGNAKGGRSEYSLLRKILFSFNNQPTPPLG